MPAGRQPGEAGDLSDAPNPDLKGQPMMTMSTQQSTSPDAGPLARAARLGVWALPVWAALLCIGTLNEQPRWQTQPAAWSRFVTTPEFLASHLVGSILGAAIGALGMVALGAVLARRGHPAAGLATMVTGVVANVLTASAFGVAAFAQPALGRNYLAHATAQAHLLIKTVANGEWLTTMIITSGLLLTASAVIAGVGVARTRPLPRTAGIGFAVTMALFFIANIPDTGPWQAIAGALMTAFTAWIAIAASRHEAPAPADAGDTIPAATQAGAQHDGLAGARQPR
jgi:hypothetical protein